MKLIYIKWIDAYGVSPSWQEIPDMIEVSPLYCESVGWLAEETDKYIVVIPHIHLGKEGTTEPQGCGDMAIPIVSIIERRSLAKRKINE